MKSLITLFVFLAGTAQATEYSCQAEKYRNDTGTNPVEFKLSFKMYGLNGSVNIIDVDGTLKDKDGMVLGQGTSLKFSEKQVSNDKNYKPRKYKNSNRFALDSSDPRQIGAINGYLIVERKINKKGEVPAHYVFQADQNGGTIDLTCQTNAK